MSRAALVLAGILIVLGCGNSESWAGEGEKAGKPVTFTGTFNWKRQGKKTHDLKGIFTPDGENKYKVVWHFKWRKKPVKYEGFVNGNIQNGEISGEGWTANKKRRWTFKGVAKNWTLQCNHTEVSNKKKPVPTGTFTIKPEVAK